MSEHKTIVGTIKIDTACKSKITNKRFDKFF